MPFFEAGPYNWEWRLQTGGSWNPLGVVDETPRLRIVQSGQEVRGDNLGDTIQDVIFRGYNMYLDLLFNEWILSNVKALWMYHGANVTDLNNAYSRLQNIGCPSRTEAPQIRATRIGTCPQFGGAQWLFWYAVPSPGLDIDVLLGTRLRVLPMQFLLLPKDNGDGTANFYVTTL